MVRQGARVGELAVVEVLLEGIGQTPEQVATVVVVGATVHDRHGAGSRSAMSAIDSSTPVTPWMTWARRGVNGQ